MFKGIRYFSVAVTDLEKAIKTYTEVLGLEQMTPVRETRWGFRNTMMGYGGQSFIELISPSDPSSALARFMKERAIPSNPNGEGIYLVGVEVEDLPKALEKAKAAGGRITQEADSPNAAWVHPTSTHFAFMELQGPREG